MSANYICVTCGQVCEDIRYIDGKFVCPSCYLAISNNKINIELPGTKSPESTKDVEEKPSKRAVDDRYSYEFGKGSSKPATDVDIHKVIDDAMEKKDRSVTIFINKDATTVSVYPYEDKKPQWIHKENMEHVTCPNCGGLQESESHYCPMCGEELFLSNGY